MHPLLLAWSNAAFYNNTMRSGLTDPFTQRPLVDRVEALAKAASTPKDDMEKMLRDLMPGTRCKEERHRFLLVDSPSLE
eukprot:879557-Pyramimonas_sp.AAC.1